VEAPDLGNEDGVMPKEQSPGKPTSRRYSPEEKAGAVRMVRTLRAELGTEHRTVGRVAHLGYGVESVRSWVPQADVDDGYAPGVSIAESRRIKELEQENQELKLGALVLGGDGCLAVVNWAFASWTVSVTWVAAMRSTRSLCA
jgi:transposase-like protein